MQAIRDRLGDPEGAARKTIGDDAFEQRRAEGQAMSVDEGVAYALSGDDPPADAEMEVHNDV